MPFVLIIVGLIVTLGLGGYFFTATPAPEPVAVETPAARPEETTTPTTPTETPAPATPTTPAPTTPSTKPSTPTPATKPSTPTTPTPTPTTPTAPATTFKNGTYNVTTSYVAPGRSTHDVTVSLTIANDIITASNVTFSGDNVDTSSSYQNRFAGAYKTQVVGKNLGNVSLARVGGASLTTNAFNKAVAEVMTKARS